MRVFKRLFLGFSVAAIVLLGAACVPQGGEATFGMPEIVGTEAVVAGRTVTLKGELSEARAERVGFVYGLKAGEREMKTVECRLTAGRFEAKVEGLAPGETYEWYAFAKAGESEVRSEVKSFEIAEVSRVVEIEDAVFKAYLVSQFDEDGDGEISEEEAKKVTKIAVKTTEISSLAGVESFVNLDTLICRGVDPDAYEYGYTGHPGLLESLDVRANKRLKYLRCDGNYLTSLLLPENSKLEYLYCSNNYLTELDLREHPWLKFVQVFQNEISSIDFSVNTRLESIEIAYTLIDKVDVSMCPRLDLLNVNGLPIKELDLTKNPLLGGLWMYGTGVTAIDLSGKPRLGYLNCSESPVASLDLSGCTELGELWCFNCLMEELDVSMLPRLGVMDCSPMKTLKRLYVSEGQEIPGVTVERSEEKVPAETEIVVK